MATTTKNPKFDIYQMVTDRIVESLEKGHIPWKKMWTCGGAARNYVSGKAYRGINALMTNLTPWEYPLFLTANQAKKLGGYIKKGEKSTPIVYWRFLYFDAAGKKVQTRKEATKVVPLARYWRVFNISQVEGIEWKIPEDFKTTTNELPTLETCEQVVAGYKTKPEVRFGGSRAYYAPISDYIQMPNKSSFHTVEAYYSTLFHEFAHSTGHSSRIPREGVTNPTLFGSHEYSKEELIAEMVAAFLCGYCGIEEKTLENSAAYLQSWLKVLKADTKMLYQAAKIAQDVTDYMLGREKELVA